MLRNKEISELLKQRFEKAYYAMRGIPSERELSEELCVARMTARRALNKLVEEGVLNRKSTGRLEFNQQVSSENKQICFLMPSLNSNDIALWLQDLKDLGERMSVNIRPVYYSSWDDVVFHSAIESFDGVFFIPRSDSPPDWIEKKLKSTPVRIVSLAYDMTALGFPSLNIFSNIFISQLLDHLNEQGYEKIDCFNVQEHNSSITKRLEQWEF